MANPQLDASLRVVGEQAIEIADLKARLAAIRERMKFAAYLTPEDIRDIDQATDLSQAFVPRP